MKPEAAMDAMRAEPVSDPALRGLAEVLSIPACGIDLSELYGLVVDRGHRLLDADRTVVFEFDSELGVLVPRASRGVRREDLGGLAVRPAAGVVGAAFHEGRTMWVAGPMPDDPVLLQFPSASAIAAPIRADGEPTGVLYVGRREAAPASTDDLRILHLLADRCGSAQVYRQLLLRAARQGERLRQLVALPAAGAGQPLRAALARICETAAGMLGLAVVVVVATGEGGETIRASHGLPEGMVANWPADWEGRLGLDSPAARLLGLRALLPVRLCSGVRELGVAYFVDRKERRFGPDDAQIAELIGAVLTATVENAAAVAGTTTALQQLSAAQEQLIQTERARALAGVAGGIAHEFNNLLAIILGKTQLALERSDSTGIRDDLGVIEETAWRAADTVRRLLAFVSTRSEEGMATVDLNALVEDVVTFTRPLWKDDAEAHGIRIEVSTDLAETAAVHGLATELREALTNLMLNAIDAMPLGGRLVIQTRRRDHAVELSVRDTGEGMSADVRARIFDPFFTTHSPQRAGLGLSVVHGIVGRHQGRIDVQSEVGRGTTITLALPEAQPRPAGVRALPSPSARPPARTGQILVIEDEEHLRWMLVDALVNAGHAAKSAANGLDGLALFQQDTFDVVITDLSMPERSGLDVARAVKQLNARVPVIMITGWGDVVSPERVGDSGVDLMLNKPFKMDRVLGVVDQALGLRHSGA
jgi:signal transduction histidine kinase/ActR/RegA family two-component response regulator